MSSELQRIHDKINYETNVVDPKTFAILLNAVKENQPLSYQNGRDNIFHKRDQGLVCSGIRKNQILMHLTH